MAEDSQEIYKALKQCVLGLKDIYIMLYLFSVPLFWMITFTHVKVILARVKGNREADPAVGRNGCGTDFTYAWHPGKYNIVPADGSRRVGIRIALRFVVACSVLVPVQIEKGLDSICLDREGANNGNMETISTGGAYRLHSEASPAQLGEQNRSGVVLSRLMRLKTNCTL